MSKPKVIIKVDRDRLEAAKTALNVFINELEDRALQIENTRGDTTPESRAMLADVDILHHIFIALDESSDVDQDPPGILESAKRPSHMN